MTAVGLRRLACGAALAALAFAAPSAALAQQHGRLFPPEQLGLLEGPDRDAWQRPDQIMDALRIAEGSTVADLGAGGGWFTIRLANRVGPNGLVYAEDVQPQMIEAIKRRVQRAQLTQVRPILGDASDPRLPGKVDAALIVDAYHEMAQPVVMLRNVVAALRPGGRVGIVEFKKDGWGPGGEMDERVDAERVIRDAELAGLRLVSRENLRYQYLLVFTRAGDETTGTAPAGPARRRARAQ
jgi:ubiquinone/menaquinone biosynthesis C-methylase UbiE